MTIGQRIKARRESLGLTQEQLAKKVGYASRSSINKLELSRELPLNKVEIMAVALDCSPSFLMGWISDPDPAYAETKIGKLEIFSAQAKEADDNIKSQVDNAIKEAGLDPDDIQKAIHLFEEYQKAPADVQSVIERLLKSSQSDS